MNQAMAPVTIAIVDYRLGNLFSVARACEHVGARPLITSRRSEIEAADGVILPGVGAFGDAMAELRALGLVEPLRELAQTKPLWGICLGMQLLLETGHEFGTHKGLGVLAGEVRRIEPPRDRDGRRLKVPHVGWNGLRPTSPGAWDGTPLAGLPDNVPLYFVHSYAVELADPAPAVAVTDYGDVRFCSALRQGPTFASQFHPERSGRDGLALYRRFVADIAAAKLQAP